MGSRAAAVLAGGGASVAKLLVASLAFTAAYVGVSAYDTAKSITKPQVGKVSAVRLAAVAKARVEPAPEPGTVTVEPLKAAAGCERGFRARSVVISPHPDETIGYNWRLIRWSAVSHTWRTYQVDHKGFYGKFRNVTWETEIFDNPGWYRIELNVNDAKSVRSEKFLVSC